MSAALRFAMILAALLVLGACTGPRLAPYSPIDQKTDVDSKKLYDAAEGMLLDSGFLIETRDEAGLKLTTQPRTMLGSAIANDKYKYVFVVETSGGKLSIQLKCKAASASGATEDCGEEVPEKLVKDQRKLADSILEEAKGK